MKPRRVFLLKIKGIPPTVLREFAESEYGAHEDMLERRDTFKPNAEALTAYEILTRRKTMIEIRNAVEADQIYHAACSGTFQLLPDKAGVAERPASWNRWARRIADALRPHAKPETVRMLPSPDGY